MFSLGIEQSDEYFGLALQSRERLSHFVKHDGGESVALRHTVDPHQEREHDMHSVAGDQTADREMGGVLEGGVVSTQHDIVEQRQLGVTVRRSVDGLVPLQADERRERGTVVRETPVHAVHRNGLVRPGQ